MNSTKSWFACIAFIALAGLLVLPLTLSAADTTPDETLRTKGLIKVGQKYLLEGDVGLQEWLRQVRLADSKVKESIKRRSNLERDILAMQKAADSLYDSWLAEKQKLAGISKNADVTYNKQVDKVNGMRTRILSGLEEIKKRQVVLQSIGDPADEYVAIMMKFGTAIDATVEKYKALADDAEVKAALDKVNKTAATRFTLGPSDRLTAELPGITKLREQVNSDTIKFEFQGGVPTVPLLVNGKVAINAVVDSGAASVTISDKLAKELNLVPGPDDRTVHMVTADGTVTEAKVMTIKSIRLGKFTIEDVECIVQPPSDKETITLLGGTFLRRFVYKMDLSAGQLKLSQVSDKTVTDAPVTTKPPVPAAKPGDGATASSTKSKVKIIKAEYGCEAKTVDVTQAIQTPYERDPFTPMAADNILLGKQPDPCPQKVKNLWVTYNIGGKENLVLKVKEGHAAPLISPPPEGTPNPTAGKEFKVVAARYGLPTLWIDATTLIQTKVKSPTQTFDMANWEVGGDPKPYSQKNLVVWYTHEGRDFVAVVKEENFGKNWRLVK